mgnify:CR=1 FL=1|jgi:hypothetical protein
MDWQTWTKISGVILFIIAIVGFAGNYYIKGPMLEIQNFPGLTDLDALNNDEDISFTFFLYNTGDKTAFVKSIKLNDQGNNFRNPTFIDPSSDFSINPGESKEVSVTLSSPGKDGGYSVSAQVYYNNRNIKSSYVPVLWGGLLE